MKAFKSEVKLSKLGLTHVVNYMDQVTYNADISRTTLRKVRAKRVETIWLLEATDGHRLVSNNIDETELEHNLGDIAEIAFNDYHLPELKLLLKREAKSGDAHMIDVSPYAVRCLKDEFPDVDTIKPRGDAYQWSISFNAEYLEEMLKAMRDTKRQVSVTLKFKDDKSPIIVECGGSSYGLLMPCRGVTQWGSSPVIELAQA